MNLKVLSEHLEKVHEKLVAITRKKDASYYYSAQVFKQTWSSSYGHLEQTGHLIETDGIVVFLKANSNTEKHIVLFNETDGYTVAKNSEGEKVLFKDVYNQNVAGMRCFKLKYGGEKIENKAGYGV